MNVPVLGAHALSGTSLLVLALALPGTLVTAWIVGRMLAVRRSFVAVLRDGVN